tara:strand:- start:4031 stop:5167 length:1137 start_codon:yes stop_codon:yes gene_type:complete
MDILASERRRAMVSGGGVSQYKRELRDLNDKKAIAGVQTAGEHIQMMADKVKHELEPVQTSFQTASDSRKAYAKIRSKYDAIRAKASGKKPPASGDKDEPTSEERGTGDAPTSDRPAPPSDRPAPPSDAGGKPPTRPIPDEVPSYVKGGDPRLATMSPEELEANRSARREAGRVMTNNIKKNMTYRNEMDAYRKGGVPSGDDGASSSFMDERATAATTKVDRGLGGLMGNSEGQGHLDNIRRVLGGNPSRTNPHAAGTGSGEEAPTIIGGAGGEEEAGADAAGAIAKKAATQVGSKLATGLGIAGDVLDALGPIGDLIGLGLSIFGGVEGAKEAKAKETAQKQETQQLNKPLPKPGASTGATFSTLKGMGQAPVSAHF